MKRIPPDRLASALLGLALAACAHQPPAQAASAAPAPALDAIPELRVVRTDSAAMARARADSARHPYTEADVRFMTGMISHHAQAIAMSRMARSHGAGPAVQRLADRIMNAQVDEIATMQQWLADRGRPVPKPDFGGDDMHAMHHDMSDMSHAMMPGMLTPEQMEQLAAAHGAEFDRLFLTFMIQHHGGAVQMVKQLTSSYGAAQDELVFKFAGDVEVDQTTEIARMQQMLAAMSVSPHTRNQQ